MALTDNILAYYKTDESSGNASDSSGGGFTLTNTGSMTYTTGKINNGADTTSTKYLTRSDILGRTAGNAGDITITGWFKFGDLGGAGGGNIIEVNDGATSPYLSWTIAITSTNVRFNYGQMCVANNYTDDTFTTATGTWYFIALRWDGTTLTGNVNARTAVTGTPSGNGTTCGGASTFVGTTNLGPVTAVMDEIGIWDRKLSDAEITELYNSGNGLQLFASTFIPQVTIY